MKVLSSSLGMQGQVPGGCNQATTNKTPLNTDRRMGRFTLKYYGNYKL